MVIWTDMVTKYTEVLSGGGSTSASAKIVQVVWPSNAKVGEGYKWSLLCEMRNSSERGYGAIVNYKGNPGDMLVKVSGVEKVFRLKPGQCVNIWTTNKVCAGCRYLFEGTVSFDKPGKYEVYVFAGVPGSI